MLTIPIRTGGITRFWIGRREPDPSVEQQGVPGPLAGQEYDAAGRLNPARDGRCGTYIRGSWDGGALKFSTVMTGGSIEERVARNQSW